MVECRSKSFWPKSETLRIPFRAQLPTHPQQPNSTIREVKRRRHSWKIRSKLRVCPKIIPSSSKPLDRPSLAILKICSSRTLWKERGPLTWKVSPHYRKEVPPIKTSPSSQIIHSPKVFSLTVTFFRRRVVRSRSLSILEMVEPNWEFLLGRTTQIPFPRTF